MSLVEPQKTKFDEDELTTILQILFVWLVEKKYHSIYMNKMVKLLNILSEPIHSRCLVNVLIKLNIISIFHEIYFRVILDEVYQPGLLAEQIILFIQTFAFKVSKILEVTKEPDLIAVLERMNNWQELLVATK
jgi:hypothetical protein